MGSILLSSPLHAESRDTTTRYFDWAALKVHPAKPTDEITAAQAASREASGEPYYIAIYDDLGRILSLEKRLNHATFFRYTYTYPNGEPVRTDISPASAE